MSISNIKVEDIVYDFSKFPANIVKEIKAKLPDVNYEKISFNVKGNASYANAIRRTALSEIEVKALDFDIEHINKNDRSIIPYILHERIGYIRINQNISDDSEFILDVINNTSQERFVYSSELKQVAGKITHIPGTIRICILQPGKYLKISNIKVIKGYGFEHSKFSITADFTYYELDYVDICSLNERGNINYIRVQYTDIEKYLTGVKDVNDLKFNSITQILVIPNNDYLKKVADETAIRIKNFKYIINNDSIYAYQSSECNPQLYALSFKLYGNIKPKVFLTTILDNLIGRFTLVLDEYNAKNPGIVSEQSDSTKTEIQIRGEDNTVGYLLCRTIYELDPSITLINSTSEHPLNRTVIIRIIHSNPKKIFTDALTQIISNFKSMLKTAS